MKRIQIYSNYEPGKVGKIALFSFIISLIFKGRKSGGKHKSIFSRFVKNFGRTSAVIGIASAMSAKNNMQNKDDEISFQDAAEIYNEAVGETVIDVKCNKDGTAKGTVKNTKTYSDLTEMISDN